MIDRYQMQIPRLGDQREKIAMATDKQIAANTANAKLSTGPKTAAGRSRSAQNSLKHGIRAQKIALLAGEEAWVDIAEEYLAHFRPVGAYQHGLVMEMLQSLLALDRSHRVEASLLTSEWPGRNLVAFQFACPIEADDDAAHGELAASSLGEGTSADIATPATNAKALANEDAGPSNWYQRRQSVRWCSHPAQLPDWRRPR